MEKYNLRLIPARQARLAEEKMALPPSVKVKRANHRLKIKKAKKWTFDEHSDLSEPLRSFSLPSSVGVPSTLDPNFIGYPPGLDLESQETPVTPQENVEKSKILEKDEGVRPSTFSGKYKAFNDMRRNYKKANLSLQDKLYDSRIIPENKSGLIELSINESKVKKAINWSTTFDPLIISSRDIMNITEILPPVSVEKRRQPMGPSSAPMDSAEIIVPLGGTTNDEKINENNNDTSGITRITSSQAIDLSIQIQEEYQNSMSIPDFPFNYSNPSLEFQNFLENLKNRPVKSNLDPSNSLNQSKLARMNQNQINMNDTNQIEQATHEIIPPRTEIMKKSPENFPSALPNPVLNENFSKNQRKLFDQMDEIFEEHYRKFPKRRANHSETISRSLEKIVPYPKAYFPTLSVPTSLSGLNEMSNKISGKAQTPMEVLIGCPCMMGTSNSNGLNENEVIRARNGNLNERNSQNENLEKRSADEFEINANRAEKTADRPERTADRIPTTSNEFRTTENVDIFERRSVNVLQEIEKRLQINADKNRMNANEERMKEIDDLNRN